MYRRPYESSRPRKQPMYLMNHSALFYFFRQKREHFSRMRLEDGFLAYPGLLYIYIHVLTSDMVIRLRRLEYFSRLNDIGVPLPWLYIVIMIVILYVAVCEIAMTRKSDITRLMCVESSIRERPICFVYDIQSGKLSYSRIFWRLQKCECFFFFSIYKVMNARIIFQ